jgi:DNA-binding winged helix-turn-helix (wHTH) protein
VYAFGPFEIDTRAATLRKAGEIIRLSDRYFRVLHYLTMHAGEVVAKNDLIAVGWGDVAVTDNSLEQAISVVRRLLGCDPSGQQYLQTVARRGYRLQAPVSRAVASASDEAIDDLLAPHRAWVDGRAALESLDSSQIMRARGVFADVTARMPDYAPAHVGLANACVLQFEMTRVDETPDADALRHAVDHARTACRLDPDYADAWATLGFILARASEQTDAAAAARRAIALEPDNWRHHLRLSSIAWGEERLRAARRTLALFDGCPLACWLAATVLIARQRLDEAAYDLATGIATDESRGGEIRFQGVALHWLLGLIHLAQGDESSALKHFERELEKTSGGHLYARECGANTWYAIGALHLRQQDPVAAAAAFERAVQLVPRHPMACLGLSLIGGDGDTPAASAPSRPEGGAIEAALYTAVMASRRGAHPNAAQAVEAALSAASPGSALWLLPVEPLLNVTSAPETWASALACLRTRAA